MAFEWDSKHGHPKGWYKNNDKMYDAWERKLKKEQRERKIQKEREKKALEKERLKIAAYRAKEKERQKLIKQREKERIKKIKLREKEQQDKIKQKEKEQKNKIRQKEKEQQKIINQKEREYKKKVMQEIISDHQQRRQIQNERVSQQNEIARLQQIIQSQRENLGENPLSKEIEPNTTKILTQNNHKRNGGCLQFAILLFVVTLLMGILLTIS